MGLNKIKTEDFEKLEVTSAKELRHWLSKNFSQANGVWLVTYKKNQGAKYVSTQEVLDELLSHGWIDGVRRKLDDWRTMQFISPRRAQHWAKSYKDRVQKLIEENRMHAAGLESIKEGKESGLWNFMDDVDQLIIPRDLQAALKNIEGAERFFMNINDSSKRFVLRWTKLAKTKKTRENRISKIAKLSSMGQKLPGS